MNKLKVGEALVRASEGKDADFSALSDAASSGPGALDLH